MDSNTNTIKWDWRLNFSSNPILLDQGAQDVDNNKVLDFEEAKDRSSATCKTFGGFHCGVYAPTSYSECRGYGIWRTGGVYYGRGRRRRGYSFWNDDDADSRFQCNCSTGLMNKPCRHVASLLLYWEKKHGPFIFTETEEEKKARIEEEERQEREERDRREREKKQKVILMVPDIIKAWVPPIPQDLYFRMDKMVKDVTTDQYEVEFVGKMRSKVPVRFEKFNISYEYDGTQVLEADGHCNGEYIFLKMNRTEFLNFHCSCGRSQTKNTRAWNSHPAKFCWHAILFFEEAWKKNVDEMPGDETDQKALKLLSALADGQTAEVISPDEEEEPDRKRIVTLSPRITLDGRSRSLHLSFTVGKTGEREYVLRSLEKLVSAVQQKGTFTLSTKASIDFSKADFTEEAQRWYDFIRSRVRNIEMLNQRLDRGYYYSPQLSVGSSIPLEGSDLDLIYDMTQGTELPSTADGSGSLTYVKVRPGVVRADIFLTPMPPKSKKPLYIEMKGSIPRLLKGNQYRYILDSDQFGRVSDEELKVLTPYRSIAGSDGAFSCRIGLKKFPEFYYRVLPMLRDSGQINLFDGTQDLNLDFLPPEPEFTFYIDLADGRITCRAEVRYAQERFNVGFPDAAGKRSLLRDMDQEMRVQTAVEKFFECASRASSKPVFYTTATEESLITILTEGVALLSQYGEVKGSDAFSRVQVRPAPQPRFSVEIEGGLLELSIRTKDLTPDELLDILASYRERKRWHRLKNGDFVDVRRAPALQELENLADSMGISMERMIRGQVQVPKFRALYVDRLLEEHDAIATARDRHFKALVRSFRTIQDSDFDVADSLTDVIRPYQLYGFRWLATLAQAGFGGILADEMGLGKTIQMLSYLLYARQAGESRPALIVCPASLVYNWKEECSRFTDELSLELLAGGARARHEQLRQIASGQCADVYVTSYDLLKRDIAHFEDLYFSTIVLDEAQFVKNQKAAVTKAVKVLKAEHRFALTGTPIENRLSELWSIFDFLMPGFLYNAQEFARRFEGPIMKKKDPAATQRLTRMTGPFVLRRKKEDVLKDLPEKLEEVQSFAMEDDQRHLYDAQVVKMRKMLEDFAGTGEDKLRVLAQITKLRQVCCDPSLLFEDYDGSSAKRAACLDLVERAIDGGHRMLVFSQFTSMLDLLAKDLKKAGIPFYTITGSTPKQERLRLVNDFNSGDTPVFLISLRAGGTGLNLVGADVVIHYDPWWNLAVQNQATDRAHRIGQTRQVTVVKMITMDTIEEKILRLQEAKREMADAIISGEGTSLASLSKEDLLELLK